MKYTEEILEALEKNILEKYTKVISKTDDAPDRWYELFITYPEGGTETIFSAGTFEKTFSKISNYIEEYRFDRIGIDSWENYNDPQQVETGLLCPETAFYTIEQYYKEKKIAFIRIGSVENRFGEKPESELGSTENGFVFKDEIAFLYFHDMICYIAELEYLDDKDGYGSTYNDFRKISEECPELINSLFKSVDWLHPSTLWNDWKMNDFFREKEETTDENKAIHSCDFDRLILRRFKSLDELKTRIESMTGTMVISIIEEDLSDKDDKESGFLQPDFSLLADIDPGEDGEYCMLTLYYYKDRQGNYVITETSFAFE